MLWLASLARHLSCAKVSKYVSKFQRCFKVCFKIVSKLFQTAVQLQVITHVCCDSLDCNCQASETDLISNYVLLRDYITIFGAGLPVLKDYKANHIRIILFNVHVDVCGHVQVLHPERIVSECSHMCTHDNYIVRTSYNMLEFNYSYMHMSS